MAKDLLFELGTEEIPARFMAPALRQMKELLEAGLKELRLDYSTLNVYGTPRRLALLVKELAEQQSDLAEEVKGPSIKAAYDGDGNPTKAVLGFARGQGVQVEDLVVQETPTGKYVFATKRNAGQSAEAVLPDMLTSIVHKLYFPKPMRWGDSDLKFARPIRWIAALLGNEVLKITIGDIKADRFSRSHRFLGSGVVELASPQEYIQKLKENYCIVDQEERKELIWEQITAVAAENRGKVHKDEKLLEEVTQLLEYPTALCGSFEEKYLALPQELLITPMREHQRYFPVFKEDGSLLPKFITVRNGLEKHIDIVTAGNEKVLRARLADAEFFYTEDLKKNLEDNVAKLDTIVFHEKLGSLGDKVKRVEKLARYIGTQLGFSAEELNATSRAAFLAKADLVSNVVYEFPELQGIMGEYYARHAGEEEAVAVAIREHYLPRFAGDELPATKIGMALSIADKLDSIVGFFGMDIQPTGSQDPYALRRQALGIVHTVLNRDLEISLSKMVEESDQLLTEQVDFIHSPEKTLGDLLAFFKQRMENVLSEAGVRYDVINAVLAGQLDNLDVANQKAVALSAFRETEEFRQLITGFKRAANLAKNATHSQVKEELLSDPAETQLYQEFQKVKKAADSFLQAKDYQKALAMIGELRTVIDVFFTAVMVMVEDEEIKENRLALLKQIADYVKNIADLSQLVD
ncbi:glycine--tRNA ligase subunit beta [Dehalobacterium formicoaceticum]|uniref:glycine--tRNA ligase subunit beta n=1 Tax=Dehalobacterium formicoaceticum TaxID=51515 RepID=UPI0031F61BCA